MIVKRVREAASSDVVRILLEQQRDEIHQNTDSEQTCSEEVNDAHDDLALIELVCANSAEEETEQQCHPLILLPSSRNGTVIVVRVGIGVCVADVNRMVKQFNESRKMMKKLPGLMGGKGGKRGRFRLPF